MNLKGIVALSASLWGLSGLKEELRTQGLSGTAQVRQKRFLGEGGEMGRWCEQDPFVS